MASRYKCAVLGATGLVGQRFVQMLDGHPWFETICLASSERSAGKKYGEACRWYCETPIPDGAADIRVDRCEPSDILRHKPDLVFTSLPAKEAARIEPMLASKLPVFSKASTFRMEPDVPLIVPEVNPEQSDLIPIQQKRRNWKGFITTDPNCTTTQLTLALGPLKVFGIKNVSVVSMQALSGAGLSGVSSVEIIDNVIPYISGEEEKVERETQKILGKMRGGRLDSAEIIVSAACNRVKVLDGHLECVSVGLRKKTTAKEAATAMTSFRGEPQRLKLPSAPKQPLIVMDEIDRPQPRLDRMAGRGMSVVIGRLREDPLQSIKFICLGHNTIRGAAGNGILHAELFKAYGII